MVLLVLLVAMLAVFWGILRERNIYNPLVLFCGFIASISFLASLQLYGMSRTSNKVYIITSIGLIAFFIGVVLCDVFFEKYNNKYTISAKKEENQKVNKNILITFMVLMVVYSLYRFQQILPLIIQGYSFDHIRMVYFGTDIGGVSVGGLASIIEIYLNLPLLYAVIPIVIIEVISNKRKTDKRIIVLFAIWLILTILITGGRTILYIIGVEFFICFMILNKKLRLGKKTKISMMCCVVGVIILMYYMSINRKNDGSEYEFIKTLYTNFSGAMPHMSYRLETINIKENYTYGLTLFSGILRPFMLIYKYIFGNYPELYQYTLDIGSQLQTPVSLGGNITFNAYVTPFYYFYYDLGYLGVVIDSIIYGAVCQWFYIKMKSKFSIMNIAFYLLIIQGIFTSMIRYSFVLIYYVLAFIFIRIIFVKIIRKRQV